MSQKTYQTLYEKIILGQFRYEKAPQVVSACYWVNLTGGSISASDYDDGMECSQPFYSGAITPFIGWFIGNGCCKWDSWRNAKMTLKQK